MNEQQIAQTINDLIRSVGVESLSSWVFEVRNDYPNMNVGFVKQINEERVNVSYVEFDLTKTHFQKPILFNHVGANYLVVYLPHNN